jgi:cytochrome c
MSRQAVLLATLLLITSLTHAVAQEIDAKTSFNNHCRTCHSIHGDNRLGRSLVGIFGSKAGQVRGYSSYSGGLKGFTWDEATLDKFIANPTSMSPSTNMIFPPIADAAEPHRIIEFLKSLKEPR